MEEVFILGILLVILLLILWFLTDRVEQLDGQLAYCQDEEEWDPPQIVSDVLTPEDCKYIIEKATPMFQRSTVVGAVGPHPSRTSETAWIPKTDPVARKVFERALKLTGKTLDNCEDLQIVRYKPGAYYNAHHDSCCDAVSSCGDFVTQGGQRVGTLLVYLNSEFTDGETHFPNYNDAKLKASPGSAIFFRPLGKNVAQCHPKALHAGLPISSGTKYVCNAWIRENKF
jgi:prolyl 4-hydroxylase